MKHRPYYQQLLVLPDRDGFTFTELLVIVTLGALLGAVVPPSLNTASDTMKAAVCVGNMHEWGLAVNMYSEDWNGFFPYEANFNTPIDSGPSPPFPGNLKAWYNLLPGYLNQPSLVDLYYAGKPPRAGMKSIWTCPSATNTTVSPTLSTPYFMYAFSARMDPNNRSPCPAGTTDVSGSGDCRFRRSQMTSPANTIVFCEADGAGGAVGAVTTVARHFGGGHFVLGDGHVELIKYDDYCRSCPTNLCPDTDSTAICDWKGGIKYHWFPFRNAPT